MVEVRHLTSEEHMARHLFGQEPKAYQLILTEEEAEHLLEGV